MVILALEVVYLYCKCAFIKMEAGGMDNTNSQHYKTHTKENGFCFMKTVVPNL